MTGEDGADAERSIAGAAHPGGGARRDRRCTAVYASGFALEKVAIGDSGREELRRSMGMMVREGYKVRAGTMSTVGTTSGVGRL
jgi:hypothetical protein